MEISRRAQFDDPQWRQWLAAFPDYDRRGGHVPSVLFKHEVDGHLGKATSLSVPNDADHATIKSELSAHFTLIGAQVGKKVELGLLATASGAAGLIAMSSFPGPAWSPRGSAEC